MPDEGEALRTGSPDIDVERSLTAFVRALGIDTNGRNLRTLRDQASRLAAMVSEYLGGAGYRVTATASGESGPATSTIREVTGSPPLR